MGKFLNGLVEVSDYLKDNKTRVILKSCSKENLTAIAKNLHVLIGKFEIAQKAAQDFLAMVQVEQESRNMGKTFIQSPAARRARRRRLSR